MHTLESNADRSRERVQPTDRPTDSFGVARRWQESIMAKRFIKDIGWIYLCAVCRLPFADRIPRPGRSIGKSSKRNLPLPLPLPVVVVFEYQRREEKERGRGEAWFTTHEWTSSSTGASLSLFLCCSTLSAIPFWIQMQMRCIHTHTHRWARVKQVFCDHVGNKKERKNWPTYGYEG